MNKVNAKDDDVESLAAALSEKFDTDVYFYNSRIGRPLDDDLIASCCERRRRNNVTLFLVTEGGDPDAAYRVARCFQTHWKKFTCVVPGYCKSAGTLLLIGANDIVMSDSAELGPLDVQMTKKDELWETESGLTVMSALDALQQKSFQTFEYFLLTIMEKSGSRVTFRTGSEYGIKLTAGLFAPIFEQIDPIHVGEASRAQAIGHSYGLRLSLYGKNISKEGLRNLISGYPSHGFVIDREEAKALFYRVREPNPEEQHLIDALGRKAYDPLIGKDGIRQFLSGEKVTKHDKQDDSQNSAATKRRAVRTIADAGKSFEQENVVG